MTNQEIRHTCIQMRIVMIFMTSVGMFIIHALRTNVAVVIVNILELQEQYNHHTNDSLESDRLNTIRISKEFSDKQVPDVMWTPDMISRLHAIFYIGFFLTQIPSSWLLSYYSSSSIFGGCIFLSCGLNILMPIVIENSSFRITCLVRACQGLSEGALFPSLYGILRHWSIPQERGRMGSCILAGMYSGPIIGLTGGGFMIHYIGWQYVFYGCGVLGLLWFICWLKLGYATPCSHPYISSDELELFRTNNGNTDVDMSFSSIPWCSILSSLPFWSICICHFVHGFIYYMLLTSEPTYISVYGFNIAENGLYSSIPHLLLTLFGATSGMIADTLQENPLLTITDVRKMLTCIGFGTKALCYLLLGFAYDGTMVLTLLTMGVGISGISASGWHLNHFDLSPKYASLLIAISNAFGILAGIINPLIVGELTHNQTKEEWQNVNLMNSALLIFAVIFYGLFASGERQEWGSKDRELCSITDSSSLSSYCATEQ